MFIQAPFLNTGSVAVQAGDLQLSAGAPSNANDVSGTGSVTGTFTGRPGHDDGPGLPGHGGDREHLR